MNDRAEVRSPAEAAAEAVKAYLRMNRARLASDGELLALLLPERFGGGEVRDLQRYIIEKLRDENASLRAERDGLKGARDHASRLGDGVKRLVLDLLDARSFEQAIGVAVSAAPSFAADRAALCIESDGPTPKGCESVRLIAPLARCCSAPAAQTAAAWRCSGCASAARYRPRSMRWAHASPTASDRKSPRLNSSH